MEGEKSVNKQEKVSRELGLKIMELVTQIAVAREASTMGARNPEPADYVGEIDELVRTLFRTMCELVSHDKPRVRVF